MSLPRCFGIVPAALSAAVLLSWPLALAGAISGSAALDAIRAAGEPRPESIAGLGVDLATGAQTLERNLLPYDAGQPFGLPLRYDSAFSEVSGPLGRGWRHDFQAAVTSEAGDRMTVSWGGHHRNTYRLAETVNGERRFRSDDIAARRDVLTVAANGIPALTRADGTQYVFSISNGALLEVRNKVGQTRDLNPDQNQGNRPRRIRAALTSAEIAFAYDRDGLIDFVYDAVANNGPARYVNFSYDAQRRLTRITQPVMFAGDEYAWTPTNIIATAGNATGTAAERNIPRTTSVGLLRVTAGTISSGRSEDLVLQLTSPSGTVATIYDRVPDPGLSRSLGTLSTLTDAFDGENPNGVWRLVVRSFSPNQDIRITSFAIRFSDPSHPTQYSYDAAHRVTEARDALGRIFANTYDAAGRVATQDDGRTDNQLVRFSYDERPDDTLVTTVTDRSGHTSSFLHSAQYQLLRWTDALGQSVTYTYDARGNRLSRTSALGHLTRFTYDSSHNLISVTDPAGKATLFQYDASRNVQVIVDARGTESRFGYDARNNQTSVTDYLGRTTRRTFNNNSLLQTVTLPDGGMVNLGYTGGNLINFVGHPINNSRGTTVSYDSQGRVTRRTDPDGFATTFTYSPSGQLLEERRSDGQTRRFSFDARDRVVSETNLLGQTTRFQYDGNDNVVAVTNALGQVTRSTYDGEDRLIRTVDALNQVRETAYDAVGQTVAETDGLGRTTRYRYDADGNLTTVEDPEGIAIARYRYTPRAETEREAGAYDHPLTYAYDDVGNLSSTVDPAGRRTAYTYDPLNRHVTVTDPANRISRQSYDADGQVEALTGPGGRQTTFAYDRANRLTEVQSGDRIITYAYNDRDLVTEVWDGNRRFQYDYDSQGRRIRTRVYVPGGGTVERTLNVTLDANGNVLRTADSGDGRSVTRVLDPLERIATFTDASGRQVGYSYDAAGRLIRLTYPGGRVVNYTYDAADQLTEVSDWSNRRTRFSYDRNGRVTRIEFPNGAYRVIGYDRASRPLERSDHEPGGAVICAYRYEYAIDGQLESAVRTDRALSYRPAAVSMAFDNSNRVTAYNGTTLPSELGGGLTRVPTPAGFPTVAYDARGRVRTIGAVTFNYDPEDRLTGWSETAGTTSLFVDPHAGLSRVLERATPDGNTTRYVHGLGLLYEETGSAIRVYHYDERGSTVALTDNAGRVTQRFAYGPYGEEIGNDTGSGTTPFRFLGMFGVLTEPNGTCAMRNRHYSPLLRRFISEDFYPGELAEPNSLNRHAYGNGNPVAFDDPDGEFINIVIGAAAGAIGGVVAQGAADLISGKKPNWKNYVSAAAGGAVTGALIGSGVGVFVAGGAGGLTENFLNQSLNGALTGERDFDFGQLAFATGAGAVAGRLGGKSVPGINGAVSSAFRKQVVRNGVLFSSKRAALRAPVADIVKRTAGAAVLLSVGRAAGAVARSKLRLTPGEGDSPGGANPGIPSGLTTRQRFDQIRGFMGEAQRSNQGPYLHFSFYETWLRAAQVPLPNSPNARPAGF